MLCSRPLRIELRGSDDAPVPYMTLVEEVSVEEPHEAHFTPSVTPGQVSLYVLTRQGRITRYTATGHLHRYSLFSLIRVPTGSSNQFQET